MCRVIAVSNQKGGVGKTVSCVNLGIGLAQEGKKVLLIDADPQGSLTISLGYEEPDEMEYSLATLMMNIVNDEKLNIEKTILHHKEGVDLIPANIELSAIEVSLVNAMSRELILRSMVDRLREFYDYIIIDCMPSLGMMTINALACADSVLIPVQAAYLPVKGLQQLIKTIGRVKKQLNPKLKIEGILLTMVDNRTNYARDISLMVYDTYSASIKVFGTEIPMSVRASEVSVEGGSIYSYDPMVIADGLDRAPAIDVSALMDYENMKEKLSVEVISADANADLLANVPHDRMEDLAVVYRFVMESSEDGRASILVTNNLMDRMGVSHEQLRADALENSPEIRPVVIMGMNEVMKEMIDPEVYEMFGIPDDAEETMYVATVPDKNSGAGVIAYQDFMDQAAERVGGDFFVLPSSINEILLVPDNGDMTADALRDMVKDVNAKEVSPEERLSDNVYHYDSKDHVFELAEKFEARQQEKKTEIDEKSEEKGSVLKDLKDKQKEAAAKPPVKDAAEKAAKSKGREVL